MTLTTKSNSEEKRSDLCRFLGKDGEIKQPELKKYTSQAREVNNVSDLIMENVEALASYEVDRDDCESAKYQRCEMLIIYADGNWGIETLMDHQKKAGWL